MVAESPAASPVSAIVPVAVAEAHRVRLRLPKFRGQETLLGAAVQQTVRAVTVLPKHVLGPSRSWTLRHREQLMIVSLWFRRTTPWLGSLQPSQREGARSTGRSDGREVVGYSRTDMPLHA